MKLSNFEDQIDEIILERGYKYFIDDKVENLDEVEVNHFMALVPGSEIYLVHVKFADDQDTIIKLKCDCPYDVGKYCKHQAAVLYALEKKLLGGKIKKKKSLEDLLPCLSKEELIELILKISFEHEDVERKLLFQLSPSDDEIENSKRLISQYIDEAEEFDGFIPWNRMDDALTGVEMVLESAYGKLQRNDEETAVRLSLLAIPAIVDMLDFADDSGGFVMPVIEEAFTIIDTALEKGINRFKLETKEELYHVLMNEAFNERYDGWPEWRVQLMNSCIIFCDYDPLREQLEKQVKHFIDKYSKDSMNDCEVSKLKEIQFKLIQSYDGESQALDFIHHNVDTPDFREKAIRHHLENSAYEKVIELCDNGIERDTKYAGLVSKWKEFKLQAYEELGNLNKQKELTKDLLLTNRDYSYYEKLKGHYSSDEWPNILSEILVKLENTSHFLSNIYTKILIEEKMFKELLEYCQKEPKLINYYHQHLIDDYPGEVKNLFRSHIFTLSEDSGPRKHYRKICREIQEYKQVFGYEEANKLINELRELYYKRPAFMDELDKI